MRSIMKSSLQGHRFMVLLVLAFFLSFLPIRCYWYAKPDFAPFVCTSSFEYANPIREDRFATVSVDFTEVQRGFLGELQIIVPDVDSNYLLYAQVLELKENEDQSIHCVIPVREDASAVRIQIYDATGAEVFSTLLAIPFSPFLTTEEETFDFSALFIGRKPVLPTKSIKITKEDRTYTAKPLFLSTNELPDLLERLFGYDIICLAYQDLDELTDQQTKALYQWTCSGGILIINAMDSLQDGNFLVPFANEAETVALDPEGFGRMAYQGDGVAFFLTKDYYKGFLFTEGLISKMLTGVYACLPLSWMEASISRKFQNEWVDAIKDSLLSWKFSIPALKEYIFILAVYVFVGLPGCYLLLRRLQKRYYMRGTVILLASIFAVLIYVFAANTRINVNYLTTLQVHQVNETYTNTQVYASVQTIYGETQKLTLSPDWCVRPIMKQGELTKEHWEKVSAKEYGLRLQKTGEEIHCYLGNQRIGTNYLLLERAEDTKEQEKQWIDTAILIKDGTMFAVLSKEKAEEYLLGDGDLSDLQWQKGNLDRFLMDFTEPSFEQAKQLYLSYYEYHLPLFTQAGVLFVGLGSEDTCEAFEQPENCRYYGFHLTLKKIADD